MSRETSVWKVDQLCPDREIIQKAGLILRRGGLVAFPTETVYGLGVNALDGRAVASVFEAKGRPRDNPLIVHVADTRTVEEYSPVVPAKARRLMDMFWPGPLTVVLEAGGKIPIEVTGGLATIAFRMPDHQVALALIRAAGVPLAAPSANFSGRPSPTTAQHVLEDLDGRIDAVLDAGQTGLGVESTVLDLTGDVAVILRPGGVTPGDVKSVLGSVALDRSLENEGALPDKPRSPGMKYRHYAPSAPLWLVEGNDPAGIVDKIRLLTARYSSEGKKVGILCRLDNIEKYGSALVIPAGRADDPASVAAALYEALRGFDRSRVDIILAEGVEASGVGLAVANRLRRAAGGNLIKVG